MRRDISATLSWRQCVSRAHGHRADRHPSPRARDRVFWPLDVARGAVAADEPVQIDADDLMQQRESAALQPFSGAQCIGERGGGQAEEFGGLATTGGLPDDDGKAVHECFRRHGSTLADLLAHVIISGLDYDCSRG